MENNKKQFKPFDRILVRDRGEWTPDIYSYYSKSYNQHWCLSFGWLEDEANILPYEGNEHLVGTTDEPDEEIVIENGEYCFGANRDDCTELFNWQLFQFDCVDSDDCQFKERFGKDRYFDLVFRVSDFNPDMDELRKHILCVKNGKVVRFKE